MDAAGAPVVAAAGPTFPLDAWLHAAAGRFDLPALALDSLAGRAGREPDAFRAEWHAKTAADRERF